MKGRVNKYTSHKGQVRWRADLDLDGSTRQQRLRRSKAGFKTRREAENALDALIESVMAAPTRPVTVTEFVASRWLRILADTVKPATAKQYRQVWAAYLEPVIGRVDIRLVDTGMVEDLVAGATAKRSGSPLGAKSRQNLRGVLMSLFRDAYRLGYVDSNPVVGSTRPKATPPERVWTADELAAFLTATKDDRLGPMWRLLSTTGLRRGEVVGLEWRDITDGTLTVRRSVDSDANIGDPKTASSFRSIALDAGTVANLDQIRIAQGRHRLAIGPDAWADTDAVFTWEDGRRYSPDYVTRRFQDSASETGVSAIGPHGLRHTWATLALEAGVNPKVVSARLGHASVAITLDRYTTVRPVIDREAAETVAAVISAAS